MSYDPFGPSGRKHRRRQKLGHDAHCIGCGRSDPTVLIRAKRTLFEQHHFLGQAHEPKARVPACKNCHAIFSAKQVDDHVSLEPQPTILERQVAIFLAFVCFLGTLAELLSEWALRGSGVAAGLDADFPDWRTKPWAT